MCEVVGGGGSQWWWCGNVCGGGGVVMFGVVVGQIDVEGGDSTGDILQHQ